jgi:MFS family permease
MGFGAVEDDEGHDEVQDPTRPPTLPRLVEKIGIGPAQMKVVCIAGAVWFADGAELLLISSVTDSVAEEWALTSFEQGLIVSLVYIGVMFGNMASGPLGDLYGRRFPIVLSFWLIFVLSVLCAFSVDFLMLCLLRILVGISMGIGQPAFQALLTETTPANSRVFLFSMAFCLFSIGEMYSAILIDIDDPQMVDLHWRWLLVMGALPALFFGILALIFIDQSPYYLSINERHEEAREVLRRMSSDNFLDDIDVTFDTSKSKKRKQTEPEQEVLQWRLLFSGDMIYTTAIMVYSCFVLNFIFYGCLYAFPNVMTDVDLGSTPAASLILGALIELFGLLFAILVATTWPRKLVMKIYLGLVTISLLSFAIAAEGSSTIASAMRWEGYYGIKFFTSIGYIVAYLYVTEVYPTACRTTGTSVCLAGGRLGAILSPEIFEAIEELSGSFTLFFYLIAVLAGLNFYLVNSLTYETQGMMLRESADDAMVAAGEPLPPIDENSAIEEDYDPTNPKYILPAPVDSASSR